MGMWPLQLLQQNWINYSQRSKFDKGSLQQWYGQSEHQKKQVRYFVPSEQIASSLPKKI